MFVKFLLSVAYDVADNKHQRLLVELFEVEFLHSVEGYGLWYVDELSQFR